MESQVVSGVGFGENVTVNATVEVSKKGRQRGMGDDEDGGMCFS